MPAKVIINKIQNPAGAAQIQLLIELAVTIHLRFFFLLSNPKIQKLALNRHFNHFSI
jgi:hypothetical protein